MKLLAYLSAAALLPFLAGCGGGGGGTGGGSTGTQGAMDTHTAVVSAAQGAVLYSGGTAVGSAYPQVKTAVTVSGRTMALNTLIGQVVASSTQAHPATSGWTQISGSNLYYQISLKTLTTVQILLSTDGSTNNAGYIDLTLVSGGPNSYPIVVRANMKLILPNETVTGAETLTEYDKTGSNFNVKGTENSSAADVTATFNLTDQAGSVTGTMAVSKGSTQLIYTNISASASGFSASFTSGTVTGSVTVNADGSGSGQATGTDGTWSLTWDALGNATLTGPNGVTITGTLTGGLKG